MADKFPNLPGIPVNIIDGNLVPDEAPGGPTVAVLGTATKGPAGVESVVLSGAAAITKYGVVGSLGRGLAEAFQGGAANAVGFRILTTAGKLEHVGDDAGVAGITIETVSEGSDALELYNILYNQQEDRLRIYDISTGSLIFDKTGDVIDVDLGLLNVTGTAENDESSEDQVFGSIGRQLPIADTEADQKATIDAAHIVLTLDPSLSGLNLGKLGFVSSESTPVMCQLRSHDGTQLREELVASVNVGAGTVTLDAAIDAAYYDDGANTGLHNDATIFHSVRFVSLRTAVRMDRVVENRLPRVGANVTDLDVLMTPGFDFNGGAKLMGSAGYAFDTSVEEVEPHKMNLYEALLDAALALEASDIDVLVHMDAYLDDPALDGQTVGETKLPTTEAEGLMFDSAVNASAGIDSVTINTISGFADRCELVFADAAERTLAQTKLAAAGRGQTWLVVSTEKGATFGEFRETDEIVRAARILNWEEDGFESFTVTVTDEDAGAGTLLDDYWEFTDGTTDYYVWYNVAGAGTDPDVAGKMGIEVEVLVADGADVVGLATYDALVAAAGNYNVTFDGADVITVTLTTAGDVTDADDSATPTGFGFAVTDGDDTVLVVHFDRELGFSYVSSGGAVEAGLAPAFQAFNTDLLFFHREKEILGELVHYWYTAKADPDGNPYNEVNFAYKLAAICSDLTENETAVIGCIGVRPPSNHFNPAAIATWIGASPEYDDDGDVTVNGSGLLGNKFISGRGLNDLYNDANQFDPGFKATESGELDDTEVVQDSNGFDIDIGKFLSVVGSWPTMTNFSDSSGLGYIASGAAMYAGMLAGLAPWRGSTAKAIGGRSIRLARRLAKRHLNSLVGARYVMFNTAPDGSVVVVDGPSAALPTSDYTRNMTVRLVAEVVRQMRIVGRPFLGDPLSAVRKAAMETKMKKALAELQRLSDGALERFALGITQSPLDKVRGTAKVTLALQIINELRKLTIDIALTL